jgi:hypothetical protein
MRNFTCIIYLCLQGFKKFLCSFYLLIRIRVHRKLEKNHRQFVLYGNNKTRIRVKQVIEIKINLLQNVIPSDQ